MLVYGHKDELGDIMSEIEVLKEVKVWNWNFQNVSESRIVGVFGGVNELFEVLKPYNISKDDFDYIDIIDFGVYDQPLACVLEEDCDITTYLIRETYTLNDLLYGYEEELEDFVKGEGND